AKKEEGAEFDGAGGIDAVLTFRELRDLMERRDLDLTSVVPREFDEPKGGLGRVYPLSHGFFQAAGITENLLDSDAISADGQHNFMEAIREFESGQLDVRLLELLCCEGCIMGAGIERDLPHYQRHARVSAYAKREKAAFDAKQWNANMERMEGLDLSRSFRPEDIRMASPTRDQLTAILLEMGKTAAEDELNCGACGYDSCVEHAIAIHKGLAEVAMCLPHTIERLKITIDELEESNDELASTREALMHSERLASMGQLAAGIAHEVNNPLGVILLYSHLLLEKSQETDSLHEDLKMIVEQTDRCKKIVSGLLNFARQNKVARQPLDMKQFLKKTAEAFRLGDGMLLRLNFPKEPVVAEVDGDQIAQVITNLIANAVDATQGQGKIELGLDLTGETVGITVTDTGCGIPVENIKKVFTPFFTTKRIGKGTGLGLAVTYGIVKMHSGNISVVSNADETKGPTGTTFRVTLPRLEEPMADRTRSNGGMIL
ncbi:histidine kinase, partial [Myxococcota bacterium]|nr:histidine kinase [Myxococcota bacterium]